mgnify:CR=1 FL=1
MPTSLKTAPPTIDPLFAEAWQAGLAVLSPTPAQQEHGLELHRSLTICESYGFLPDIWGEAAAEFHGAGRDGRSFVDFQRRLSHLRTIGATANAANGRAFHAALRQAGIHGIVQPVNDYGESLICAVQRIAAIRHLCLSFPDTLHQVVDADGIERARAAQATAIIYSLTGLPIFGTGDMTDPTQLLEWVLIWHGLGVRFMHLGYNRRNLFADGCTESNDGGLSDLGRDLIQMMNEVGIIVDVPHSSRRSLLEACQLSRRPVIASHMGCRAVWDGVRCKSDEEIKAIAATSGYVGIFGVPWLLGNDTDIRLMLEHIRHAVNLVGPEHVVIGADTGFNLAIPGQRTPHPGAWRRKQAGGWNEHSRMGREAGQPLQGNLAWTNKPLLTIGLVQMGLSDEAIAQIHFGNLKRVLDSLPPTGQP